MVCSCCGEQRNELRTRKSKLMAGMNLFLCSSCDSSNKEPRFVIILTGRANGAKSVSDYILKRRYCGDEILARELIV